jgi:glycosyltransferase involved in cell wall biosynthesis
MSRLSRHYPVLYVEEPVRAKGPARLVCKQRNAGVEVLVPHTPVEATGFRDDQLRVIGPLLTDYLQEHGIDETIAWFYTPMASPLIASLQPQLVVYDCMEDLSALKHAPAELPQREATLLQSAALVFAAGPALYEAKRRLHPRVHCVPSAVDPARFSPSRLDPFSEHAREADRLQERLPHPRLGFFGIIDERIDLELLDALATARPDWQLVMAGPVLNLDAASLPRRPNIHWLGRQPQDLLPYLMAGWDVCLMPFALNDATRCISPTKTLEYMAGEKPIVSTAVPDVVALYGDVVRLARDPLQFIDACAELLRETGHQRARRLSNMTNAVFRTSWESTAQCIHELIEHALQSRGAGAQPAARTSAAAAPLAVSR